MGQSVVDRKGTIGYLTSREHLRKPKHGDWGGRKEGGENDGEDVGETKKQP